MKKTYRGSYWAAFIGTALMIGVGAGACLLYVNRTPSEKSPQQQYEWSNEEAASRMAQEEQRKVDLFRALTTRPLTDEEMKEAVAYGDFLNIPTGVPYFADEKRRELADAFVTQWRLRAAVNR